jgi:serine/threonine protein kinase
MFNTVLASLISICISFFTKEDEVNTSGYFLNKEEVRFDNSYNNNTTFYQHMANKAYADNVEKEDSPWREGSYGCLTLKGAHVIKREKGATPTLSREWEALSLLRATGLVPRGYSFSNGELAMEYIEGSYTLHEYLHSYASGDITSDNMYYVLKEVLNTIKAFWSYGWVHNDMHPSNILVQPGEEAYKGYIIDVAFATSVDMPPQEGNPFHVDCLPTSDAYRLREYTLKHFPSLEGDTLLEEFFSSL